MFIPYMLIFILPFLLGIIAGSLITLMIKERIDKS